MHWSGLYRDAPAAPLKSTGARIEAVHDAVRLERASGIVRRLFDREVEGIDLEPDLAVSDIELDSHQYTSELAFLARSEAAAPVVIIAGQIVPVSLELFFDRPWRFRLPLVGDIFPDAKFVDRNEARTAFLSRAAEFLANRIAALRDYRRSDRSGWGPSSLLTFRQIIGGKNVTTPGCNFTVSTNSTGLRVFWSGAYFVSPNYFNHPTTPTSSVLQAGTYVFGVDGGAYGRNIQWDLNSIVSLPGQPYVHLNY